MSGVRMQGDIVQNLGKVSRLDEWVAGYLGNGIIGGCFDYCGLQFQDKRPERPRIIGDTYFVSQYHYVHGNFGMDYALPIGRLQARIITAGGPVEPSDPRDFAEIDQTLSLAEGVLNTAYSVGGATVHQQQFFSQVRKNLFALRWECGDKLEFDFKPIDDTGYHYASHFHTDVTRSESDGCALWSIPTNLETTVVGLMQSGNAVYVAVYSTFEDTDPAAACIREMRSAKALGYDALLEEHKLWWRAYWRESNVTLPHPFGEIWQRANYYMGCSLADVKSHPPLVFGLARVQWPGYFPQDYYYAYANLLAANHLTQAQATSTFWHEILPRAREHAKDIFGLKGAAYPWMPPVFDWSDYLHGGVTPNPCYYEMHNSAYVAKMCWDYYLHTRDESYLREQAYPVIREIALMYADMTTIVNDRAQILFDLNASQDEYNERGMPNFIDTLFSAEYTLTLAQSLGERLGDQEIAAMCSAILDKGYAYERIELGDTYAGFEGDTRTTDFQKHPVQLNPIALLPIPRFFEDDRILNYHARRYDIGAGYKDAKSAGWTLGEFMIAAARLRKPEELRRDAANLLRCRIMDPDYIQVFESSGVAPHYLTTIGLIMQSITETLLQTHSGVADFFPCVLPEWRDQEIGFESLRAPGGFLLSGTLHKGKARLSITSTLGGEFAYSICGGKRMRIETKPGETHEVSEDVLWCDR